MATQEQIREEGDVFHPIGACILRVVGASKADLLSSSNANADNLVVAEANDSCDMDAPAVYAVQPSGKRHRLGKLKGHVSERMEARSFWGGLGHRAGIQLVARALPNAETVKEGKGSNVATPVLVIVKAQCGVFDVREFKKGYKEDRDQRPGRALNALLKYCDSGGLPTACKPFYNAKALKLLIKRPLSLKDLDSEGAGANTTKKAGEKAVAAASRKRSASSTIAGSSKQVRKTKKQ